MKRPELVDTWYDALVEERLRRQVAREQHAIARANVQRGCYTNGDVMTPEDLKLHGILTTASVVAIVALAMMVAILVTLAVVGK
jgi:hypothetical protein